MAFLGDGTEPAEHDVNLTPALITADNLGETERAAEVRLDVAVAGTDTGQLNQPELRMKMARALVARAIFILKTTNASA